MHREIVWSVPALIEYKDAIQYLLDEWGELIAVKFRNHTDIQLKRIVDNPLQFPLVSTKKNVRRCIVSKHISIFFTEKKKIVYIIRFFNNRQNPGKLRNVR